MWVQNVIYISISLVVIHLMIGGIRGMYRFRHINKYHYDYYEINRLSAKRKLRHNLLHSILNLKTLFLSIALSLLFILVVSQLLNIRRFHF